MSTVSTISKEELKRKRVGVLLGGLSSEREVSLRTGAAVAKALRGLGYDVVEIDVGKDLPARLVAEKVEVAFIALHGRYGEDGCVQGLLESHVHPLYRQRRAGLVPGHGQGLRQAGLHRPRHPHAALPRLPHREEARAAVDSLPFGLPAVVKPSREGSSVGVHIVQDARGVPRRRRGRLQAGRHHPGRAVHQGPRGAGRRSSTTRPSASSRWWPRGSSTTTRPSTNPGEPRSTSSRPPSRRISTSA